MKHWKSITALVLMPPAFYLDLVEFYFALLFLIWSIQGIKNRNVFLLDYITEQDNPVLFWITTLAWLLIAILSLIYSEPFVHYFYTY